MTSIRSSDLTLQNASRLMKMGRFSEALIQLRQDRSINNNISHEGQSILADALQRTGQNQEAEQVASRVLSLPSATPAASARCYFVMGNVRRERGLVDEAITHFQTAARLAEVDLEMSCWIQLRLLVAVAELAGGQTAMTRLAEVRRCLTRLGDARPFAALHIWIAEIETTRGCLDSARRHLGIAQSLLAQIDDAWLHGYFAINSFGVSYYSAEISEARKWADVAIEWSRLSGHAGGRRAAHANLGHIEFSQGHPLKAEECFRLALECSEPGSTNHFSIMDSIAQIRLYLGDFKGCQVIVDQLEHLSCLNDRSSSKHQWAWALQTRIQLLLKQGRFKEANEVCKSLDADGETIVQPRVRAVLGLLSTEALLANREFEMAATRLGSVLSTSVELAPDLLAETERLIAKTLSLSGAPGIGGINLQRALDTFDVIGHAIGKTGALSDASEFRSFPTHPIESLSARSSLDRIRVLLETRRRPELLGLEASRLLMDLDCAAYFAFSVYDGLQQAAILCSSGSSASSVTRIVDQTQAITIKIGSSNEREFTLSFVPKADSSSILAAVTFQRIIERILILQIDNQRFADFDIPWSANERLSNHNAVFATDSMMEVLKTVNKIAATNLSVLITGETGTGKEIIAKTLHEQSDRAHKAFIALNCAAVPRELIESQLFGYRRGAYSGANEQFQGVIRAANGGTLLLDEVGEIPVEMQPKLLRFLESGEVHPLGESRPTKVDVRLLFATNANLEDLVKQRLFREDLYFRINVIHIKIPPLRERREEIPLLVSFFAQRFGRELSREIPTFAAETMEHLILHQWPGNIRQLSNEVRRLVAMSEDGAPVTPDLLSAEIRHGSVSSVTTMTEHPCVMVRLDQPLSRAADCIERKMLEHALQKANGRVAVAARMLGLSRKGLYLKRQRLGMVSLAEQSTLPVRPRSLS